MKTYIRHRVNTIAQLEELRPEWGAEIDLRSTAVQGKEKLILSHDVAHEKLSGVDYFEDWLKIFSKRKLQGPLILNTKEDGLEERIFALLEKFEVRNYFFLDTALPTLVKWTVKNKNRNFAVRVSEFEPVILESHVNWAWVDCFDRKPIGLKALEGLGKVKICLVSPELQGGEVSECKNFSELYQVAHAICTKNPGAWIDAFGS